MFGWTDPVTKLWVDGILVKRARNALAVKNASESLSSKIQRGKRCSTIENSSNSGVSNGFHQWIVLDGPIDHGWLDQMNSLFEGNRSLTLGNGEMVPISGE